MTRIQSRPLLVAVRLTAGVVVLAFGWCVMVALAMLTRVGVQALVQELQTW